MIRPNPKLNAEGWEVTPAVSNAVRLPTMIEVLAGKFFKGIVANHLSPSVGFRLTHSLT
jgi:hypothetical protein